MNEKDESCRELVHVYVHAEAKRLFNRINEFSLAGILLTPSLSAGELRLPGNRQRGQPPASSFLPKTTTTIVTEETFESWMGAPKSQKRGEVFSFKFIALQNTNGQEVNLSVLLVGDWCAMQSSRPLSNSSSWQDPATPCR